jgi:hypothetical protein
MAAAHDFPVVQWKTYQGQGNGGEITINCLVGVHNWESVVVGASPTNVTHVVAQSERAPKKTLTQTSLVVFTNFGLCDSCRSL